ncbi:hypothetical protein AXX17_AT5G37910 [Arabidopsis thaliana]|uniref:Uncharacterized protein n=1 Tax=Arabidopsis thaliana TaxID=3702 RepID=A0A178U9Z4_ARATH|nr:hypothetical protein AXX17_AT5G37910 [Arabidopsis thaliana]
MASLCLMLDQRDKFFYSLSFLPLSGFHQMILQFRLMMVFLTSLSRSKAVWNAVSILKLDVFWAPLVHPITYWLFLLNRNPTLNRLSSWSYDV